LPHPSKREFKPLGKEEKLNKAAECGYLWNILTRDGRDKGKSAYASEFDWYWKQLEAEGNIHDDVTAKAYAAYYKQHKDDPRGAFSTALSTLSQYPSSASVADNLDAIHPVHPVHHPGSPQNELLHQKALKARVSNGHMMRRVSAPIVAAAARLQQAYYGPSNPRQHMEVYQQRLKLLSRSAVFYFTDSKDEEGKKVYGGKIWEEVDSQGRVKATHDAFRQERERKASGGYLVYAFLQREFGKSFQLSRHDSEVSFGDVFIWAVLLGRLEIAKICFRSMSRPLVGALVAAAICKKIAEDEELGDLPQKVRPIVLMAYATDYRCCGRSE
jgi:hypothetical protein